MALLLTACARHRHENEAGPVHAAFYAQRIQWWLKHSSLHLYVVDSCGSTSTSLVAEFAPAGFEGSARLHVTAPHTASPTPGEAGNYLALGEAAGLARAVEAFPRMISDNDYIFKLTGELEPLSLAPVPFLYTCPDFT